MALFGSVILLLIMGYGINLDVDNLAFAVLDRDQTTVSENYILNIAGSRYFVQHPPIASNAELDRRMATGEISLAIEIPPNFGRDIAHGRDVKIGAWVDGAMPVRAEIIQGYVQLMHLQWLEDEVSKLFGKRTLAGQTQIEIRYRYNPGFESLIAMVPAVIPLLLLVIPANLAALSVVREKELGSIVNFYVTPVTRFEFLYGKQIPYIVLAMVNFFLLTAFGMFVFHVPFTGDFLTFALAALLYVTVATGMGMLISAFMRSQVAAIFATTVVTMIPAVHFSGLIDPVSSITGPGRLIGEVFPTSFFITVARGTFSKALGFVDLQSELIPLAITGPDIAYRRRAGAEEAGQLRCASPTSCSSESRNCAASGAITSWLFLIFFVFTIAVYTQATVSPELLNRASISIVDEDQSQLSARIAGAFYPPRFLPPKLINAGEMDRRMDQGTDTFALDIPPHFERDVLNGRGRSNEIQLNVDATRVGQAFAGGGYVQEHRFGRDRRFRQPLSLGGPAARRSRVTLRVQSQSRESSGLAQLQA